MTKILHIAPQNFAGMPYDFVKMHRAFGHESRLVTMYANTLNFDEDICLGFELPTGKAAKKWRDAKSETVRDGTLPAAGPKNFAERIYFSLRDAKNSFRIQEAIREYGLLDYDVYHFDGGIDLYRDLRFVKELKKRGKKIICCYYGSDLRTRGIFQELDAMSDLNLTVEFDHLRLHKNINYIFFPFDTSGFEIAPKSNSRVRIIHSPTNRKFKGTDKIIEVIREVEKERDIEFILLENMDRHEVMRIKATGDIAIDQVGGEMGGSGYGRNSIENLCLGVPTVTEFFPDYFFFLKENPFVNSGIANLKENLLRLIDSSDLRSELAVKGREWVEKYHSYEGVNRMLNELYQKYRILS